MKKIAIFFLLIIMIIASIWGMYYSYKAKIKATSQENFIFDRNLNKEILGSELATIINKAIDRNIKNEVEKNQNQEYKNNNINSISIEIKMKDNDKTYTMEQIYNGKIQNFVLYYGEIKFKCTKIEYHRDTKLVKYMLFEQITQ